MPAYSVVYSPVICPSCGNKFGFRAGQTTFFWGWSGCYYSLGESIAWLRDKKKEIVPPFTWYTRRGWLWQPDAEFNSGSPEYQNLIAFDAEINPWPPETRNCLTCHARYDHIGVIIRDGKITEVKVFAEGEIERTIGAMDPFAEIVLIRSDGTYEPRPDWNDPPMGTLEL